MIHLAFQRSKLDDWLLHHFRDIASERTLPDDIHCLLTDQCKAKQSYDSFCQELTLQALLHGPNNGVFLSDPL